MPIKTKKLYQRLLPYLGISIEIPFFSVRSALFRESLNMFATEWIRLEISLWKWSFSFNLYSPERSWVNRNNEEKVAYYRLPDDMFDFLQKVQEENHIVGLDYTKGRTIGFVVKAIEPIQEVTE